MLNNNELYNQLIINYPPQYNINDLVKTSSGIGYISGRAFREREKVWKYTIQPYSLNTNIDVVSVYNKVK